MQINTAIQELQAAGRYLMTNQLAWGNAGNLSARLTGTQFLITASGTHLGELGEEDLVIFPGDERPDRKKPSKETPMHAAVYQERPEIQAVLHASPFYSTLVSAASIELPNDIFVEDMYYLERIARVRYCHPGSEELGEAVREKAKRANLLILENHGVLVYDTSVKEALMGLHTLEIVCKMVIEARSAGLRLKPISREIVNDFLASSGYRPKREWSQ